MTNDIQKPGNPWLDYGNAAAARSFFGTLLKFSKGEFLAGMEDRLIPIGTEMVANMESLAVGWVRWKSNMPVEQRMGLVADGFIPVNRSDLGDADQSLWETNAEGRPRDPWQLTNHLIMFARDLEVFTFVTSSRGGLDAVGELSKTYGKQMHQRPNQFPLIELEVDSYPHRQKRFGRIKIPVFKVVGWTDKGPFVDPIGDDTPPTGPTSSNEKKAPKAEPPEANTHYDPRAKHQ
jgi:hypothetical protein